MKNTKTLYARSAAWLLALGSALAITACGGGGGDAGPGLAPPTSNGTTTVAATTPNLTVTGPTRVVANTVLSYSASVANGTASAFNWAWGDAAPSTPGAAPAKVWTRPGSFNGAVQATLPSGNITAAFAVTAVGNPVSSGNYHTCAIEPAGTVRCWGQNEFGQLGNGTTATTTPTSAVTGLTNAVALAASTYHTCALQAAGTVRCWGDNSSGQLGNGTITFVAPTATVQVTGLTDAVALSGGGTHACALKSNGSVACWGYNYAGQLGINTTTTASPSPALVGGLGNTIAIAAGNAFTCALQATGKVMCWGENRFGELGNGTVGSSSSTPTEVVGLNNAITLSAGGFHACAILANGSVRCWGYNGAGTLGNGTTLASTATTAVSSITNAIAVAGGYAHTCALLPSGSVSCWGSNKFGGVGNHTTVTSVVTPSPVSGMTDAIAISSGNSHTCALRASGAISCWGLNSYGQLGDGTTGNGNFSIANKLIPTPVLDGNIFWK